MKYTSVLPAESRIIERSDASLHHGAVLECIMAQGTNSKRNQKFLFRDLSIVFGYYQPYIQLLVLDS